MQLQDVLLTTYKIQDIYYGICDKRTNNKHVSGEWKVERSRTQRTEQVMVTWSRYFVDCVSRRVLLVRHRVDRRPIDSLRRRLARHFE